MKNSALRAFAFITVALGLILAASSPAYAKAKADPENRLVIVIDGSGSFKNRQAQAIEKAVKLLEGMGTEKLQRWEKDSDRIVLISMDAVPDVLWQGSARELKAVKEGSWISRFKARDDLSSCTDVLAAMQLVARNLEGDPRNVHKYLIIFSDFINEPPTGSVKTCAKADPNPPAGFPWEALKDVSVSIFWCPPDQKLIWQRDASKHGISAAIYSKEAEAATLPPPPKPVAAPLTEAERAESSNKIKGWGRSGLRFIGWVLGLIALSIVALLAAPRLIGRKSRKRLRRPPARQTSSGNIRR